MKKDININIFSANDVKFLAKPFAILMGVVIVFGLICYFGYKQITAVSAKLKDAQRLQGVLTKNLSILQSFTAEVEDKQTFIDLVLPSKNSPLFVMSQVKFLSFERGLTVSNMRAGASSDSQGLIKSSVSFDLEGEVSEIDQFIQELSKSLPISLISKLRTTIEGSLARASFTVDVFSADNPDKIPALTAPKTALTDQERQILIGLTQYRLPQFVEPTAQDEQPRSDPFAAGVGTESQVVVEQ